MKELDYALGRILYATTGRDLDENSADAAVLGGVCGQKIGGENHQKGVDVWHSTVDRSETRMFATSIFFVRNVLLRIHGRQYFVCKKKSCLTRLI